MATTRLWTVKSRLDHLVKYVADFLKTDISYTTIDDKILEKQYVTCLIVLLLILEVVWKILKKCIMMKAK